ncbi:glutathione-dependent formaldehyde dehydrogenase [Capsulimonas corticalis]|uniref:Glutathione-dependent formaldehyde dehydrogenase n=1 Tax=Capsulimonas corticalis TaxID=2219043 RepID=A0A402CUX1_9BACT|nr:zinc-dependent alcohol dehydrogenase [Capsulimonas corticalis]BDI29113.1 glutathione-dependent formaldehyde dehydrogenase [Capsulimonas corticalis]
MRALCWHGKNDVRVDTVPDPKILNPRDAIVKITATAICGSDLHIYNGFIPTMERGDILGHEFMGEIVEVGGEVKNLKKGDRVVVPFTISCGHCSYCEDTLFSLCDNSNPNAAMQEEVYGASTAALYGYSHLFGGYAGGQAQYARVPYADVGPIKIESDLSNEQVLFLSDILPTAWMGVENAHIKPGGTLAIWGCGPVAQLAIKCAFLQGAGRVIALDHIPERLELARQSGAEVIDYTKVDNVTATLKEMTGGRGPDGCMDSVGLEAHGTSVDAVMDKTKQVMRLASDRIHVLREMVMACRKGGSLSVVGVYGGIIDAFPMGAAFSKGLNITGGQTHVQRYLNPLLERIQKGELDPSFIITHRLPLEQAPEGYSMFKEKRDKCIKVVLTP